MKKLALLAFALGFAGAANAQTAVISQTGEDQTATVSQTGSTSNEAYVTQLTDYVGAEHTNTATVTQSGVSNFASVSQTELAPVNDGTVASVQQSGDHNDMWQTLNAPGSSTGQTASAVQTGDRNRGVQTIDRGYWEGLTLSQTGDRNDSEQLISGSGGGYNYADVIQLGDRNFARQYAQGTNEGAGADAVLIDQAGNDNDAYQSITVGGFSQTNNLLIDQNGNANYANQVGAGRDLDLRVVQDGNSNWASMSSTGNTNYMNVHMSHDADLTATQTGNDNELRGLTGAGSVALVDNGSALTVSQVGNLNDANVSMTTGGSGNINQAGNGNVGTVHQF